MSLMRFQSAKSLIRQAGTVIFAMFLPLPFLVFLDLYGDLDPIWSAAVAATTMLALFFGGAFMLEASKIVEFGRHTRGLFFAELLAFSFRNSPVEAVKLAAPGQVESWIELLAIVTIFAILRSAAWLMIFAYALTGGWAVVAHYPLLAALVWHFPGMARAAEVAAPVACVFLPVLAGWLLRRMVFPLREVVTFQDATQEWNERWDTLNANVSNSAMMIKFLVLAMLSEENVEIVKEIVGIKIEQLRQRPQG